MKHTFFDKIILFTVLLVIAIFIALAGYMSYATQKIVVHQQQETLTREALLLSRQSISPYLIGTISLEELQTALDEFGNTFQSDIWFYSADGKLVAASSIEDEKPIVVPTDCTAISSDINMKKSFAGVGTFYDIFSSQMISIGVPVYQEKELLGYMMLHASMSELDTLQSNIKNIMYMPLFVTILIVGIVLAYLSGTVLRPIAKINYAAKEFAKGNFEVKTGVNRRDEIGELSDSLEYMASELSKLDEYRRNFIANISPETKS